MKRIMMSRWRLSDKFKLKHKTAELRFAARLFLRANNVRPYIFYLITIFAQP